MGNRLRYVAQTRRRSVDSPDHGEHRRPPRRIERLLQQMVAALDIAVFVDEERTRLEDERERVRDQIRELYRTES